MFLSHAILLFKNLNKKKCFEGDLIVLNLCIKHMLFLLFNKSMSTEKSYA